MLRHLVYPRDVARGLGVQPWLLEILHARRLIDRHPSTATPCMQERFLTSCIHTAHGDGGRPDLSGKDIVCLATFAFVISTCTQAAPPPQEPSPSSANERALLDKYCVVCHSDKLKTG